MGSPSRGLIAVGLLYIVIHHILNADLTTINGLAWSERNGKKRSRLLQPFIDDGDDHFYGFWNKFYSYGLK